MTTSLRASREIDGKRRSVRDLRTEALQRFRPYPVYKDSGVEWLGKIPAHWEALKLKRVCSLAYGDSLAGDARADGEVEVYGSNGPVGLHDRANTLAPCLVIGRKGSFGKVNYAVRPVFAIDTTFFVDRRFTRADLRWLYYAATDARLDSATKDSAIPGLDREDAYARDVCVPSTPEQRVIAAFLDRETVRIDALVAKKERLIELLQEKRTALITRAVTKGLDPTVPMKDSGAEWLGEIPVHWKVKPVGAVANSLVGFPFPSEQFSFDEGTRLVRGDNVTTESLRWAAKTRAWLGTPPHSRYHLMAEDIVLGMDGSKVGRNYAMVEKEDLPLLLVQRVARLRARPNIRSVFLFWSIVGPRFHAHVDTHKSDPAIPHITLKDIETYPIAVPPLDEQLLIINRIVLADRQLRALVERIREAIECLKELRTALISAAVTGKIDVREEVA